MPDGRNSKKAKGFGASMNREEAPVLPWGEAEVRFRRMNLNHCFPPFLENLHPIGHHPRLAVLAFQERVSGFAVGERFGVRIEQELLADQSWP
ncbi:MAG: hypothetical protein ABIK89_07850 [Planctomycetota bacterium]